MKNLFSLLATLLFCQNIMANNFFKMNSNSWNTKLAPNKNNNCQLLKGDEFQAVDFVVDRGQAWCKVKILSTVDSKRKSNKRCSLGQETFIESWGVQESPETQAKFGIRKPHVKPLNCNSLGRISLSDLAKVIKECKKNSISMETPISVRPCDKASKDPKECNCRGVASGFGYRKLRTRENVVLHQGVDITAARGLPVRAAADGIVKLSRQVDGNGRPQGWGRYIEIEHVDSWEAPLSAAKTVKVSACGIEKEITVDKITSLYAHLKGFRRGLKDGDRVKKGEIIGYLNSDGESTGDHLHMEIKAESKDPQFQCAKRRNGEVCDPYLFINFPNLQPKPVFDSHCG